MVIDCHSHILPGIDDGAKNEETSLEMLRRSGRQGVQCMIATPHFYAWRDRIDDFLARRQSAYEAIRGKLDPDMPRIRLGAEVAFFKGVSRAERIDALRIEGTDAILLEMPFAKWTREDIDEVEALVEKRGFRVVLAHIERYMDGHANAGFIQELKQMPVKIQINAESLGDWRQRGKLLRMFKREEAHLLGSDCHGVNHRPPNLIEGREVLRKKLGQDALDRVDRLSEQLIMER